MASITHISPEQPDGPDYRVTCDLIKKHLGLSLEQIAKEICTDGPTLIQAIQRKARLNRLQHGLLMDLERRARLRGGEALLTKLLKWGLQAKQIADKIVDIEQREAGQPVSLEEDQRTRASRQTELSKLRNHEGVVSRAVLQKLEIVYEQEIHHLWHEFLEAIKSRMVFVCSRGGPRDPDYVRRAYDTLARALAKMPRELAAGSQLQVSLVVLRVDFEVNDTAEAHTFLDLQECPPQACVVIDNKVSAQRQLAVLFAELRAHVEPYLSPDSGNSAA